MAWGLIKASNYYNKIEAIKDWQRLVERAELLGRSDLVGKFQYKESAGVKTIDRQAMKLKEALDEH